VKGAGKRLDCASIAGTLPNQGKAYVLRVQRGRCSYGAQRDKAGGGDMMRRVRAAESQGEGAPPGTRELTLVRIGMCL
jgi:hypothetical protein